MEKNLTSTKENCARSKASIETQKSSELVVFEIVISKSMKLFKQRDMPEVILEKTTTTN